MMKTPEDIVLRDCLEKHRIHSIHPTRVEQRYSKDEWPDGYEYQPMPSEIAMDEYLKTTPGTPEARAALKKHYDALHPWRQKMLY